ncbi:signal recognition particle-docking protein FtsY [Psychrobium sp. MM17-31]|nr:signal recognition particle-docking protein FtsY [Psychrobium sp. MM17-31]MCG7532686.1 signal recognition particle-docking protein FtsY [Psychrobium sp. MM17-31]
MFGWLGFGRKKEQEAEQQNLAEQQAAEAKAAEEAAAQAAAEKAAEEAAAQAAKEQAAEEAAAQAAAEKAAEEAAAQAAAEKAAEEAAAQAAAEKAAEEAAEEAAAQAAAEKAAEEAAAQAAAEKAAKEAAAQAAAEKAAEDAAAQAAAEKAAEEAAAQAAKEQAAEEAAAQAEAEQAAEEEEPKKKSGFFARLKEGLKRTKQNFGSGIFGLFKGKKIDDDLFEELEEQLLIADVGVDTTLKIIDSLTQGASRKDLKDGEALYKLLQEEMVEVIKPVSQPLDIEKSDGPYVILMVGVNGVGKTTTIGKLAKKFQQQGKKVALAAGDTFRAAAVEQLQVWGERNDIQVIAQHTGADSASVIFDAVQAAKARNVDVLIADTAGRLQNKSNLMEELKKVVRVMRKLDETAPHEVMLTLDAGTGQNAMSQVQLFNEAVGVTGLTITKLDGTAKGGVVFALADKYKIPIRYIGVGEGIDDLREFNGPEFVEALFTGEEQ